MDVMLIDDIVDTAGTITKAADLIRRTEPTLCGQLQVHAVMSDLPQQGRPVALKEIIFTDSIPYSKIGKGEGALRSGHVCRLHHGVCNNESISSLYVV